ncbi:MAG TPA: glycosyltransferase [Candidatus Acidoferrum sp.]|nr:glycosyltransferase [Candidatus Acidoferrum sp.]
MNWTTLGPPLLQPLASQNDGRLIAPPDFRYGNWGDWQRVLRAVWASDTLFWMQGPSRPEWPILVASLARGPVRRSAYVIDAWKYIITKIGTLATVLKLDPCFVAFREGYKELKTRFPSGQFEWLPFGIDTNVFDSVPGERPIFAYWMGRRHEPLHQAMLRYCADRGLDYRYTQRSGEFSPSELGKMVGSSRYFLVTPPDVDHPERTGGFSPLVMRYFEGLAAGARLLGVLPRSGEYEMLLPLDAILQVARDGSDLAAKLDEDQNNPNGRAAVEKAREIVRQHHSWARRAEQIFDRLNTGKATGFNQE